MMFVIDQTMKNRFHASDVAVLPWPQHAERFDDYVEQFLPCFRRRDQARWMVTYLTGLLWGEERKNAESLARSLPRQESDSFNLAQALQNFVNQSPWDEQLVWKRYRQWVKSRLIGQEIDCVVAEIGFCKQGNRSVGVQRQHWQEQRKKVNCQLAVVLYAVGRNEAYPIGLRLYLPRSWTNDTERLIQAGVPESCQGLTSKKEIALDLLSDLEAEDWRFHSVQSEARWAGADDFREAMSAKPRATLLEVTAEQVHYPWTGLPPGAVSLQISPDAKRRYCWTPWPAGEANAQGFRNRLLIEESDTSERRLVFCRAQQEQTLSEVALRWERRQMAAATYQRMNRQLGLNHFEGRSWRGFHHHLCLVALAYGFLTDLQR